MSVKIAQLVFLLVVLGFASSTSSSLTMEKDGVKKDFTYNPPNYKEKAKRARYMLHYLNWGNIATISTHYNMSGWPFSNVIAVCDGPLDNSTGTPYFYVSSLDASVLDIAKNNNVSLGFSEMETSYCDDQRVNAESPICGRLTLSGQFVAVTSTEEKKFALDSLFSRFPDMKTWPAGHDFFPAKLNLQLIWLIDFFGGAAIISKEDFFAANPLL